MLLKNKIPKKGKTPSCAVGIHNDYRRQSSRIVPGRFSRRISRFASVLVLGHKDGDISAGFTLVELMVTVGIFLFMTALVVAKYGSFNDGTLLTSMSYDVALALRSAQSYGLNVQGYNGTNSFNYPYGMHFNSSADYNNQMILFADSYPSTGPNGTCDNNDPSINDGVCQSGQTVGNGDNIITTYTLARGGLVASLCATN